MELGLETEPPVNGKGEEVTGDENPLGGKISVLSKICEIAQVGASLNNFGPYSLFDHSGETDSGFAAKPGLSADEAWMGYPKKSVAVDIDADGLDNVITAVFNASPDGSVRQIYFMVQQADGSFVKRFLRDGQGRDIESYDWMRDFTTGDFDGDRDPEFAVSCMTGIVIFDHEFNRLGSLVLPDKGGDNYPLVRIEAGDLNNDHCDDLVIVNGCLKMNDQNEPGDLHILSGGETGLGVDEVEGSITDFAEQSHVMDHSGNSVRFASAEVVIFDADHDGYSELALAGVDAAEGGGDDVVFWYCYYNLYLRYIDPYNEVSGNFQYSHDTAEGVAVADKFLGTTNSDGGYHPRNVAVPRMAAGHFDRSERDMVNVMDIMAYVNDDGEWENFDRFVHTSSQPSHYHFMGYDTVAAGDVTGDGLDDLVYATWSDLPWQNSIGTDYRTQNVMSGVSLWGVDNISGTYGVLETLSCSSTDEYPALTLANVDQDSVILEYLGYTLNYGDPKILAVMASPPYDAGLGDQMDLSESGTSFSISGSQGEGSAVNWGFHVDVFTGVELETPEGSSGVEISLAITNSFDWSWGQMYTKSTTLTYNTDAGMDKVIFAGVSVDTYSYRVISYGEGTYYDPGETVTINVPRKPRTSSVELSYYNEIVPEESRIPKSVYRHTIGDPRSYYGRSDKEAFEANASVLGQSWLFSTDTMDVSHGSGVNEISTATDVASTSTFDYDLGIDAELKIKAGFAVGGYGVGAHAGYGYTYEVSQGVEVSGAVGVIENSDVWENNNFDWGLMMIPQSFGNQEFNLVTYWVE